MFLSLLSRYINKKKVKKGNVRDSIKHSWNCVLYKCDYMGNRKVEKMSIGENIRKIREKKGIIQSELAKKVEVSQSMIVQAESGAKVSILPLISVWSNN